MKEETREKKQDDVKEQVLKKLEDKNNENELDSIYFKLKKKDKKILKEYSKKENLTLNYLILRIVDRAVDDIVKDRKPY